MKRCADCKHAHDERDAENIADGEPLLLRCGAVMPFWVPLSTTDFASWVDPEDGRKCKAFEKKD